MADLTSVISSHLIQVPQQHCRQIAVPQCHSVPKQSCHSVPVQIPDKKCKEVKTKLYWESQIEYPKFIPECIIGVDFLFLASLKIYTNLTVFNRFYPRMVNYLQMYNSDFDSEEDRAK